MNWRRFESDGGNMSKKKKKPAPELFYHLRVTEHKDLKGKRDFENRKILYSKPKLVKVRVIIKDRKNPDKIVSDYVAKVKAYKTRYNEGNVIRWSTSYYAKNADEVKALSVLAMKQNAKTNRTDISAIAQLVQGKVTNRRRAYLKPGTKVSKPAKLVGVKRRASKDKKQQNTTDFVNALNDLELDYRIGSEPKARKKSKRVKAEIEKKIRKTGGFKLSFEEQQAQKYGKAFVPRKVTKSERLQKRRIKGKRGK